MEKRSNVIFLAIVLFVFLSGIWFYHPDSVFSGEPSYKSSFLNAYVVKEVNSGFKNVVGNEVFGEINVEENPIGQQVSGNVVYNDDDDDRNIISNVITFFSEIFSGGDDNSQGGVTQTSAPSSGDGVSLSPPFQCNSISQGDITWTFSGTYTCGQYINGDYWVLGPVNIQSVSPAPNGGSNGNMINPTATPALPDDQQAYDDRIDHYNSSLGVTFPRTLNAGQSLVSTESRPVGDTTCDPTGYCPQAGHTHLLQSQVLTVVGTIPPEDAFRPPFVGTNKPIYHFSDLNLGLLPSLPLANKPSASELEVVANIYRGPWLDHKHGWTGRLMHPLNMPNYGREIGISSSRAAVLLEMDYTLEEKRNLTINFVQTGIDLYWQTQTGTRYYGDGGHGNGRKTPILFAGILLEDQDFINVEDSVTFTFQEDEMTYYSSTTSSFNPGQPGIALWGRDCVSPYTNSCSGNGAKDCKVPSESFDGCDGYRNCCTSNGWAGQAIAMWKIFDSTGTSGKTIWNYDAFFDYVDRWMGYGNDFQVPGGGATEEDYIADFYYAYRPTVGSQGPFNFSLSANPTSATLERTKNVLINVDVNRLDGASQPVSLSVAGLPSGVTAQFIPTSCSPSPTCTPILNLTANSSASLVTAPITISGTNGSLIRQTSVSLTVINLLPFNYSVSINPNAGFVVNGSSVASNVDLSLITGNTQSVSLSALGLPLGASANFVPTNCNPTCSSTMTIQTAGNTPLGSYDIIVSATNGSLVRTMNYNLTVQSQVSISGLVGHWKFDDDISDGQAADSSGFGQTGTCSGNCPAYDATGGNLSGAYDFDGTNDRIAVADNNRLDLTTQGTVMAWVKLDGTKWNGVISKGDVNDDNEIAYEIEVDDSGNNVDCKLANGLDSYLQVTSTDQLQIGTWAHVSCSWNGSVVKVYVNGGTPVQTAQTVTPYNSASELRIGMWGAGDWFNGRIDDVRIYNRSLSQGEIQAAMGDGTGPPAAVCGNSIVESGEVCDPPASTSSCTASGGYAGTQSCNAQCNGYGTCTTTLFCGDGATNGAEQCDDSNTNSGDGCSATCTIEGGSTTTSLTQYGITWNFTSPVQYGQFINGDYWIVGPVTVQSITVVAEAGNPSTPTGGRNGFIVNPMPRGDQPFDSRAAAEANNYNGALQPALPLSISTNSSIVSTISNAQTPTCVTNIGDDGWAVPAEFDLDTLQDCSISFVKSAAVLTVLTSAPPNNGTNIFRPAYSGTRKILYSNNSLQTNLLPSLAPIGGEPAFSELERVFQRPWIDFVAFPTWWGRQVHPSFNMPDYGSDMVDYGGMAALRLMQNDSMSDKNDLLNYYIQLGIDNNELVQNGMEWVADGGHASGRKLPILFAGTMLNNAEMLDIGNSASRDVFGEDCQTYYNGQGFPVWQYANCNPGDSRNPQGESNTYFSCCTSQSWIGQTLAARLLGLEEEWNYQAYFDFEDRWVAQGYVGGGHFSDWSDDMWNTYRGGINTCSNTVQDSCSLSCILGSSGPGTATVGGETGVDCGTAACGISCGGGPTCDLTSASWSSSNVTNGTQVTMTVTGNNCAGQNINFTIKEYDFIAIDDFVVSTVASFPSTTWTAVWTYNGDDDIGSDARNYYFEAFPTSNSSDVVTSGILDVNQQVPLQSCAAQGGNICAINNFCPGTTLPSSDAGVCCNVACVAGVSGLVGHWKFDDDINDSIADDSSASNFDGTCSGGSCPAYLASGGNLSGAYDFTRSESDTILVNDNNILDLTSGTVMAWVKLDSTGATAWHGVVSKGISKPHNYGIEINNLGIAICQLGNGAATNDYFGGSALGTTNFHHVACSWGAGTLNMYVDGNLVNNSAYGFTPATNAGVLRLGSWTNPADGTDFMDGRIDDVRIYNRSLSQGEVQTAMSGGGGQTNQAPVVSNISHNIVDVNSTKAGLQIYNGTTVTYSGNVSDPDGNPVVWRWLYTVNGGAENQHSTGTFPPTQVLDVVFPYGQTLVNYTWILRGNDSVLSAQSSVDVEVVMQPSGAGPSCDLTFANWSTTSATEQQVVNLIVNGTNCNGQQVSFEVFEDDAAADDPAIVNATSATFVGNGATGSWTAEWQCDGQTGPLCNGGLPEYYFIATLVSNSSESVTSSQIEAEELKVNELSATCGNNITQGSEQCDDGNTNDNDACTNICQNAICGDGIIRTGSEQCDNLNLNGATCTTQGFTSGTLGCTVGCTFDTSFCTSIPVAPTSLSATPVSPNQINLNWVDNSSNEQGFYVERAPTSAFFSASINRTTVAANSTSFSSTGLNPVSIYFYRVRAFNAAGNSTFSNTANATTLSAADTQSPQFSAIVVTPTSPVVYSTATNYRFNVTWTDNTAVANARLRFNGVNYTMTANGNIYSATLNNLSAGTYSYLFFANDSVGNSNQTSTFSYDVSQATTSLGLSILPSNSVTVGTLTTATGTGCPSGLNCTLTRNGGAVLSPDVQTLSVGTYVYNYSTSGNANYTASSATQTLNVNFATCTDADGDGYIVGGTDVASCGNVCGVSGTAVCTGNNDCNDANGSEFPGQAWYQDSDGDGYGDAIAVVQCARPGGDYFLASELISTSGDCNDGDSGINPGAPDVTCDGINNNCIGGADEGYVTTPTTCGVGICTGNTGQMICVGGVETDSCNPTAGAVAESCDLANGYDGDDNNCDGTSDLDCELYCDQDGDGYTPIAVCALGPYSLGDCDDTNGGINPIAQEVCDLVNNDCDAGTADGSEELWYGSATSCGVGQCSTTGILTCSSGIQTDTCTPLAPTTEICDAFDNDCDTLIDEDAIGNPLTQACYSGANGTQNVGLCEGGTQTCSAGVYGVCVGEVIPIAEQCDAGFEDESCDGNSNEGCGCTIGATIACGSDVGECSAGIQTCEDVGGTGVWGACTGAAGPSAEICDGVDNNCDSVVDETGSALCDDGIACTVNSCGLFEGVVQCYYTADAGSHAACNNGLFCDGVEQCDIDDGCVSGTSVSCVANDISGVNSCTNTPDGIPTTLDTRTAFTSTCIEASDSCSVGSTTVSSSCSLICGAECINDNSCSGSQTCNSLCECTLSSCSSNANCEAGEYCDLTGSCVVQLLDGAICDEDSDCSSGSCASDYSGGLSYCVSSANSCSHLGVEYANSANAPECFSGSSPRVCNNGNWEQGISCDNGLFCDGTESCNLGSCVVGISVQCGDGISCTSDSCDEGTDSCLNAENDNLCGVGEICDTINFPAPTGCGFQQSCSDADGDGIFEFNASTCSTGADVCGETNSTYFVNNPGAIAGYLPIPRGYNITNVTNLYNVANFSIELPGVGKVEFSQPVNLVAIDSAGCFDRLDFNNASLINLQQSSISLNSGINPGFDRAATLTFYNINMQDPKIHKDGNLCTSCSVLNYTNSTFVANVTGFSTYTIVEGFVNPDSGGNDNSGGNNNNGGGSNVISGGDGSCNPIWSCTSWSECESDDGIQTRSCTDIEDCDNVQKPLESRECGLQVGIDGDSEENGQITPGESRLISKEIVFGAIGLIVIIGIIIALVVSRKNGFSGDKRRELFAGAMQIEDRQLR